ncbi:Glyoxalase-like domain-containing protein [Nakamurella panacisegetis]|uniref:Glyoxalase-like domain-containing protein n=1 Tax=Nakamurella panacisegetis TaxID=1090615 RepID=A0A1H0P8J6_9ACTN|nr:VOC family protein [Nakamurella panacisegetis]SDP01070.1 Glyoxalase-like domain-containing protein [Nakamurella panacisegetis]
MTITALTSTPNPSAVEPRLDHLVYATPELDATVAEFVGATGVRPAEGGRHVGRGTRNYLVGLGPGRYLEIIGPDIEHPATAGAGLPFGIEALTASRLLTWAVRADDVDSAAAVSAAAGADLGPALPMSRRTPDGRLLQWRLASAMPLPFGGVTPFLIDWGRSAHPSSDPALPTLSLQGFEATHPDPDGVRGTLEALQLRLPVDLGMVGLQAVLATPQGSVRLS